MKGYKDSIKAVAMADIPADMFVRSSILAYIFEKPKDQVMDDLLNARGKALGLKPIPKR